MDFRARIQNALSVAANLPKGDLGAAQRALRLAVEALKAAEQAVDERDAELDAMTSPERDAAAEVVHLTRQLETARVKITDLELRLLKSTEDREIEERIHEEERRRLAELQKKSKLLDKVLMEDDDAFSRFMDDALDEGIGGDSGGGR